MKKIGLAGLLSLLVSLSVFAALPVTDTFTSGTGTLPTGGDPNWAENTNGTGHFKIDAGNTFATATDNTQDILLHRTVDIFNSSQCSTVVMGVISTAGAGVGPGYGFCLRCDTSTTQKTGIRWVGDSHGWQLVRFNNGAQTTFTSDTTALVLGDIVKGCVTRVGANDIISITKNGVALVNTPFTDSSPLSAGAAGISHSSTTTVGAGIETWTGENGAHAMGGPMLLN